MINTAFLRAKTRLYRKVHASNWLVITTAECPKVTAVWTWASLQTLTQQRHKFSQHYREPLAIYMCLITMSLHCLSNDGWLVTLGQFLQLGQLQCHLDDGVQRFLCILAQLGLIIGVLLNVEADGGT